MQRSTQWIVVAAIVAPLGIGFIVVGLTVANGTVINPLGAGILFLATGVGAVLVSNRFRNLERAGPREEVDRVWDNFR